MMTLITTFCSKWGCDELVVGGPETSHLSCKINAPPGTGQEFDGTVSSLKLVLNGRWGNYVFQLINMFHIAEVLGARRVYICPTETFPIKSPVVLHEITVDSVHNSRVNNDYQLEGVFFRIEALGDLATGLSPERRRQLACKYVRPLMSDFRPATDFVKNDELLIHIRSGDIFQGVEGQGGSQVGGALYIQPPLAFYSMICRSVFGAGNGRVLIVAENTLNPVIYPLIDALQKSHIAVSLRVNHDLVSDINCLLAGRKAVFANGTIGIAIALLSDVITDGYFFRRDGTGTEYDVEYFLGRYLRKHYVYDRNKSYIQKGEWRNTLEQRKLMNELSPELLEWEKEPALKNVALNKPARQSSVSPFSSKGESARAVNGIINGSFSFHTEIQHFPWWEVELLGLHKVERIVVYNRNDVSQRAYGMQIFLLAADNTWRMVHDQGGRPFGGATGKAASISIEPLEAKAVRIQLPSYQYLHLDEIEVYALVEDEV